MEAFFEMLKNVVIFVLLAFPGYILLKTKILKSEHSVALSKVLMYVGMPFLILTSTINKISFDKQLLTFLLVVAVIGIAYIFAMFFLSKPLSLMEKESKKQGMMRFSEVFANNGFLGIPIAIAVFPNQPIVLTVVVVINIINNVLLYTLGIYLVSGDKSRMNVKKAILNPVLIAFIIGLVLNLIDINLYIPEVTTYSNYFSNLVTPLSMFVLGMKMGDIKFTSLFKPLKLYYVSFLRLVASPVLIVGLLLVLKLALGINILTNDLILGVFVAFAMPTAGLASTFSDEYKGDTEFAVIYTLGTTVLSVATLPLLYWLLSAII